MQVTHQWLWNNNGQVLETLEMIKAKGDAEYPENEKWKYMKNQIKHWEKNRELMWFTSKKREKQDCVVGIKVLA